MTALPDPAELAPTRDPAAYGGRRLLSGGFWVMMGFCALCLAAAVAIVALGPRLLTARRAAVFPPAATQAPAPAIAYAPSATPLAPPVDAGAPGQVAALGDRVARLESGQARALDAAAEALAAAALGDAAAQPRPFASQLAAFQRALPASPDALALEPLAGQGAPTRAALAADLSDLAARVSVASRAPGKAAGIMAQITYAISRVVNVRRLDPGGTGADATLARAQHRAVDGDLEGALASLDALSPAAGAPLQAWREKALRRIAIDGHIAGLRSQAVADLTAARAGPSGASRP
jgi:hypothetical protein